MTPKRVISREEYRAADDLTRLIIDAAVEKGIWEKESQASARQGAGSVAQGLDGRE